MSQQSRANVDAASHRLLGDEEFFEMSLDHLCVAGFDGYWKRLNPSWTRTLGWTAEELMSRPLIEFCHPDDREAVLAARRSLFAGRPIPPPVNRYRCKDGSYRWFEWRSVSNVERQLVYAIARDVTAEKEAQRVRQELTESLTATLNSIAEAVLATRADGAIAWMNPVAERITGWTSGAALGRPVDDVFQLRDPDARPRLLTRDGRELPIAFSRSPLRNTDGNVSGAVLVFRDTTAEDEAREAQERMQRQLILADRLASLGTLAAGVAHEINNPLAYMMANLEMVAEALGERPLRSNAAAADECREMTREAIQGAERIRKIVRGLRTFSRADEERRAVIEVWPVLDLSIEMTLNEIRHRARLVRDQGAVPTVEADESRLAQVFINLLVNAAQAIPEGDTEGNEVCIATSTDAAGRAVIEVRDTGPGIPEAAIGRIFDPFFTTKPIGVGTGLGLSICHGIVGSLKGQITATNREGRGAVFRVVLPAAVPGREGARAFAAERAGGIAPPVVRAAVLVVDDELSIGTALVRALRGHDVTVVTTAREALDRILGGESYDVILSDLMMPSMSGMDLYEELVRRGERAAERIVFMTGGAFTPAASAFLDRVPNERMEKPFAAAAVRALVQRFST